MTNSIFLYSLAFLCVVSTPSLHAMDDSDDSTTDSSSASIPEMNDADSAATDTDIDHYFDHIMELLTNNPRECFDDERISNVVWRDMESVVNIITNTPQAIDKDILEKHVDTVENLLKNYCDAHDIDMTDPHTGDVAFSYGTFIEYLKDYIQGMESDHSTD